jgi:hypothetical protein
MRRGTCSESLWVSFSALSRRGARTIGGQPMPFDSIEEAIRDIREGRMVIVADDEDRENEGDLVCAAAEITSEHVYFRAIATGRDGWFRR